MAKIIEQTYEGRYFVCIYDESSADVITKDNGETKLIGIFGLVGNGIPAQPATLWFTENMEFVRAEDGFNTHNCRNCYYRNERRYPDECECFGHSIHDINAINNCEEFKM